MEDSNSQNMAWRDVEIQMLIASEMRVCVNDKFQLWWGREAMEWVRTHVGHRYRKAHVLHATLMAATNPSFSAWPHSEAPGVCHRHAAVPCSEGDGTVTLFEGDGTCTHPR
ncbi:hypothetical protein Nepgr_011428 [Nepenthes gracilis]|uniref:Uncharacterized protein n=1 Tax=Nepenthes gracilis TaxID=150966 RepID=A0AAD3SFF9_NEPGR|nr:hypothetical protein Nepgr_011428 [Nepenthes gracilis]